MVCRETREQDAPSDRPLKQQIIKNPWDALGLDWVKQKGGLAIGEKIDRWVVLRKDGWAIAEILEE